MARPGADARPFVAVLVVVLGGARSARADDTHYQDFVIGGRAVGLGGAFTAIADDATGVFFNPAGIVDSGSNNVQVSTSLYGFERGKLSDKAALPVPGAEDFNVSFADLLIIPATAGAVNMLGKPGHDGRPNFAYAFSLLVPSFRSFYANAGDDPSADPAAIYAQTYQRRVSDRELWAGGGVGWRWTPQLRLGAGVYYVFRTLLDQESVTVRESLGDAGDKFETVNNEVSAQNGNLILVLGAKYAFSDRLTLGASLRSPSVSVHNNAELRFLRTAADPSATGGDRATYEPAQITDARSETDFAPAARLGLSYSRYKRYTLSADASFHAPVRYRLIDVDTELRARLPFNPRIKRHAVVNFNAGAEYLIIHEVSMAAGVFTDFSSAPRIPANPSGDQPPNIDLWGLTFALGYFGEHTLTRVGAVYSFGTGYDVVPEAIGGGDVATLLQEEQTFRRVTFAQAFFYIFISSTIRF